MAVRPAGIQVQEEADLAQQQVTTAVEILSQLNFTQGMVA
jgi:hypothetical protein